VTFGKHEDAHVRAVSIETGETTQVTLADDDEPYAVDLPGTYMGLNALAAIAVGRWLGVSRENIQAGLDKFEHLPMRMAVSRIGETTVIDDSYNANPESVCAALDVLSQKPSAGVRIAVLGDMMELGEAAVELHRMVGTYAAETGIDVMVAVGEYAEHIVQGARDGGMAAGQCTALENRDAAVGFLVRFIFEPNVILIKGSRGARMNDIVDNLSQASGEEH
jgi:UDP-N-acetylmuramoyl-tripeptide--D-alanyl-D-alanine ligase